MPRLNNHAYNILAAEIKKLVTDPLETVRRDIVLRRLNKLRIQKGKPATFRDLKAEIEDIFPDFDQHILRQAANANRGGGLLGWLGWGLGGTAVAAGTRQFDELKDGFRERRQAFEL
ncbi:MAG: hypothetical protein ACFBSG_00230 [Leptolyngbyaceae cyanobacterium]